MVRLVVDDEGRESPMEEGDECHMVNVDTATHNVAIFGDTGASPDAELLAHAKGDLGRALDHIEAQAADIARLTAALDDADDAFVAIQAVEYSAAFVPEQYEVNVDQIASAAVGRIRAIRGGT